MKSTLVCLSSTSLQLEVIAQRANLQTTGTIYNKETQQLVYADIDIVARSQSVVRNAYLALQWEEKQSK
jgi:hypothetical protein